MTNMGQDNKHYELCWYLWFKIFGESAPPPKKNLMRQNTIAISTPLTWKNMNYCVQSEEKQYV